jgi:cytochrome c oxidase accessory protein FixG
VFARFREQVCLVVCPYGRLQGVLLDPNSVVIAYDYKRGEPRGKLHKDQERTIGDCIDCNQCVHVCPTKIDIRNGTQLECVNCSACIDECNTIMDHIGKPRGLIRYTSENSIRKGEKFKITTRIIGYSFILLVLLSTLTSLLIIREDVETTVLRTPGLLFQKLEGNKISNLYNIKIVNKTFHKIPVDLRLIKPDGEIKWVGYGINSVSEDGIAEGEFFIVLPKNEITKTKTPVLMQVWSENKMAGNVKTSFLGPND